MTRRERSVLCVPGSNWRMIEKAAMLVVDLAFIDLEDAVAPNAKVESRQQVIKAFHSLDWRGKPRAYRINALDTPFCYRDLIEVVEQSGDVLDTIIVPKVGRPEDLPQAPAFERFRGFEERQFGRLPGIQRLQRNFQNHSRLPQPRYEEGERMFAARLFRPRRHQQ